MSLQKIRLLGPIPAIGLGLLLSSSSISRGQSPASGSGSGTGTGASAGSAGSTGTGSESSSGLGTTSGAGSNIAPQMPGLNPLGNRGNGPRVEPMLQPRLVNPGEIQDIFGKDEPPLVREALSISDPGERSLALVRIARTSIFLGRPDLGHTAIFQAAKDCELLPSGTLKDQKLVNVILAALTLAEEHMREVALIQTNAEVNGGNAPPPKETDRASNLERGKQEWELAFRLSFVIENRSARTETLYRVVESQSLGSSSLVREPFRISGGRPDPAALPPQTRTFSDNLLDSAIQNAVQIERPVWRDRALVAIASNSASSGQFARALQATRAIPQPEIRTDGLLKVAENEVIFGRPDEATEIYAEVAKTISEVPDADPRETLVGVLIDSLIAFGRFDDARASTILYANPANPPIALSAVAESQGRRNLANSARKWIDAEPSAELRSLLLRKLNDGVLASIEQRRSSEFSRSGP